MVIEQIQYDDKKGWFLFRGDDHSQYCISYECYLKIGLHIGDPVNDDLLSLLQEEDRKNRAMDLGKNFALYRPRTVKEVRDRLWREKFLENEINNTLDWLLTKGFLDDSLYAQKYAQEKSSFHGWSKRKIFLKLREKGIDAKEIEGALSLLPEKNEKENLILTLNKSYGRRDLKDPKEFQRVYQAMIRRGFSSDQVLSAMKQMAKKEE